MANIWYRSRFVKTLIVCGSLVSTFLGSLGLGRSGNNALAVTECLPDGDQPISQSAEIAASSIEDHYENLECLPLFLPSSRGTLVAASDQLSPRRLSQPSLFWIQDQMGARYGSDRLIERWQAYQVNDADGDRLNYVDAIVNERIWDLLTYFERYAFLSQFGTAAQDYGYHLRVFHTGDAANADEASTSGNTELVMIRGAHVCHFDQSVPLPEAAFAKTLPCEVILDSLSRSRQRSVLSE